MLASGGMLCWPSVEMHSSLSVHGFSLVCDHTYFLMAQRRNWRTTNIEGFAFESRFVLSQLLNFRSGILRQYCLCSTNLATRVCFARLPFSWGANASSAISKQPPAHITLIQKFATRLAQPARPSREALTPHWHLT